MTEEKFEWRVRLCETELTFLNSVLDELLQYTQAEKHEVSYERRRNQNKNYPLYKKANDKWFYLHWKQSGLKNMIRRPPRSTRKESSAASDVYKRQS